MRAWVVRSEMDNWNWSLANVADADADDLASGSLRSLSPTRPLRIACNGTPVHIRTPGDGLWFRMRT